MLLHNLMPHSVACNAEQIDGQRPGQWCDGACRMATVAQLRRHCQCACTRQGYQSWEGAAQPAETLAEFRGRFCSMAGQDDSETLVVLAMDRQTLVVF